MLADLSAQNEKKMRPKQQAAKQVLPIGMPSLPTAQNHRAISALGYGKNTLKLELKKKPKKAPIIIEGFPGFGFVATIAVEYLMDHLKTHSIGRLWSPKLAPIAFIHGKRVVQPLEVFHNDKNNIIVLEAVAGVSGLEWEIADSLVEMYKKLGAKEIISIEGIGSPAERKEPKVFYWTNNEESKKAMEAIGVDPVKEGIIFGVSGALMLKVPENIKATFIFAETHSDLPDSRAAAGIIKVLDKYLDLKIDYKPLLKKAEEFEVRLRVMLEQAKQASQTKASKEPEQPYIG
jgi:predicted ATP-grasp superfamily ATP-dependent carboligase